MQLKGKYVSCFPVINTFITAEKRRSFHVYYETDSGICPGTERRNHRNTKIDSSISGDRSPFAPYLRICNEKAAGIRL